MRRLLKLGLIAVAMILALLAGARIGQSAPMPTVSPIVAPVAYLPMIVNGEPPTPTPEPLNLKGVGAIHQYPFTCEEIALTGATQYHNWLPDPPTCPGIEPVCMWWGINSHMLPTNPDCDTIILWNEPQFTTQSDIAPQAGAADWPTIEIAVGDRDFTTPCADLGWLNTWANTFKATNGRWPRFDYVCAHSYPHMMPGYPLSPAEQTMQTVEAAQAWSLAHGGNGKVWLHEFALWKAWCPGGTCVEEYIQEILPWLEAHQVPYNWFALSHVGDYMAPNYDTSLIQNGELTSLGEAYVTTD